MTALAHPRRTRTVWLALLALTGLSYGVAQVHLGLWGELTSLAIAGAKATLVGLFFMHLRDQRAVLGLVALATVLWVAMLLLGVAADVGFR